MSVLERLWFDFRFGLRCALKTPVVTAVAVATLAVGITATTVSFSVMNALFIRPLDIPDADRFVRLYSISRCSKARRER